MARKQAKIEPKLTAAAIYARYSSHNQKEESIEQQVDECLAFAEQNGLKVVQIYADKAISGKTDRRANFQRMMRDAEKQEFSVVIAYKSNRISRNMLQALTYESRLDQYGVRTLYAKEEFGNTAAGRFALRTMMNVNQFYSENMAEDIKRGMRDNAENCKVNGALSLGYVKGEDGKYAICEEQAEIVREIYDRVLAGHSYISIADDLNSRGIKTKSGGKWNKSSFHRLLRNDIYIGIYRHSGVVVEGGVPPILDKEVFYSMQEYLDKMKNGNRAVNQDYLLTGKLYCGHCKSYMVGVSGSSANGQKYYYYMCNNRRLKGDCDKSYVPKDYIEKKVAEFTQSVIMQDDVIEWIADRTVDFQIMARRESDLASMEAELSEQRKAAKNIMAAIEQGIITATTKSRLLEIEDEIATLERSITITKAATKPLDRGRVVYILEKYRDGDVNKKDFQKRLIDTFVKAVYVWDDKIKIDYYHFGENNSVVSSFGSTDVGSDDVLTGSPMLHHLNHNRHCLTGAVPIIKNC